MKNISLEEIFRTIDHKKFVLVVAGANGCGKTTFAKELLKDKNVAYLNPDEILDLKDNKSEETVSFKASRFFIDERNTLIESGGSFVLETTLSGRGLISTFKLIKQNRYAIFIIYTWLDNPQLCIERIKIRAAGGGHSIPNDVVTRRFYRSHNNFWNIYRHIAGQWVIFYNGYAKPKLIAVGKSKDFEIVNENLFDRYKEIVNECEDKRVRKRSK